ncbi:proton-conducting transporter transmembrane domain-containing protein [Leptospira noguchii]|uniref:NADH-ubiquinone/plastoquinone complex I subunit n=3 Tax=Leptospira noguchii TaxID=28182 RepID=M6UIV3_9LEPT|nr:proton-conducting transporter membrane subunit [Leptospira noguchii]EKR72009.1 NADH-ubiquinone/plastoquinone complex I subunit [Leptospira noguchii str. 2006001870]EMI67997.1 NADH-ubiquinone/plastoquinone complex I subunit [Leptospira noguchii str. Bonito]EMM99427.1 NADH-ubiquinone/plastoquinone complex I subunit [Leptospira noguchii str. 2007001578]EMO40989.1 NADH-ubiquinone/plastoquinone complex I subunit [Leptospira noguchii serovar Autumnalis str. ZUN142]EMS82183.1 NADH-ubiquinone/plast
MNLFVLNGIGVVVLFLILLAYILAPTKGQKKIAMWSFLMILCTGLTFAAWNLEGFALQWVLIEATTFTGALLVSSSRTSKLFPIAWKFLLINSFGLGIAFLGIIIITATLHGIDHPVEVIAGKLSEHPENLWLEIGLWLAIFGYSAKLGLFPNHVWVVDTYGESPSQISALIAAFVPVAVSYALRPFIHMDHQLYPTTFSASDGLLILGVITMLQSIVALYQRNDLRMMTAKVALFHSGAIGIFLWMDLPDSVFNFVMAGNIVLKSVLFLTMGIVRMDAGKRELSKIFLSEKINKKALSLYTASLFVAFVLPGSPIFVNDLLLLKVGWIQGQWFVITVPFLGLIFFGVLLYKTVPLFNLEDRPFAKEFASTLQIRMTNSLLLFLMVLGLGIWGFYHLLQGEF